MTCVSEKFWTLFGELNKAVVSFMAKKKDTTAVQGKKIKYSGCREEDDKNRVEDGGWDRAGAAAEQRRRSGPGFCQLLPGQVSQRPPPRHGR